MFGLNRLSTQTPQSSTAPTQEEHQLRRNVQTHDLAESLRQRRMKELVEWAQFHDVPLDLIGSLNQPFPTNNVSIRTSAMPKTLAALATGAALALGTGGAGLGLWSLLKPAVAPGVVKEVERWGSSIGIEVIPPGEQP